MDPGVKKIGASVVLEIKGKGFLKGLHPGYLVPLQAPVQAGTGTAGENKLPDNGEQIDKAQAQSDT